LKIFLFRLIHSYPVGPSEYLYGEQTEQLTFETGEILFQNNQTSGLIQLSILCPQNLKNPFLLIRTKKINSKERSIAPNCYACGFNPVQKSINSCKHEINERAIQGTYCISEINFALKLGYQILKIFSAIVYKSSRPILRDFISILGFEKLTSCKFDPNFDLREMKQKMFFEQELHPQLFKENLQKRNFTKLALNSFLGKFSQKSDKPISKLVSSKEDVTKLFYSKTFSISEIFAINQHFCHVKLERKRKTLIPPNPKTNCILGAHVVAFARQFMHEKMMELENLNAKIMYTDTDSLIFTLKKNQILPFKISPCFGDFKFEIPNEFKIVSFYSLGPKNFSIKYETTEGILKDIIKLRGITLKNEVNKKLIDSEMYDIYLQNYLLNKKIKFSVPQVRSRISKHKNIRTHRFTKVFFTNSINSKRIIDKKNVNLNSFPFGFVNKK
jgi:hypothetical protein